MFFYLHIPFCRQKCRYCKFALTPRFDELKVRTYLDALKREMEEFFLGHPDVSVETIYFGGGTPSILTSAQISEILGVFRTKAHFFPNTEITLEANPEDITDEYLAELSKLWINRLSLGIQTLNADTLSMVGRSNSNEAIFRALECIARGPIDNVSVDLIAGLPSSFPWQTVADLNEIFARIAPKHVSIYMLEDESYPVAWAPNLPNEEAIRSEYLSGIQWLGERGFHRYELSNFARPGFESKHNRTYWNHSSYRGFGLSAASFIDGERFSNDSSFSGYYQGKRQSDGVLTPESLRIERIMFGLRSSGVAPEDIGNPAVLQRFQSDGLLEMRENRVFPTSTWIFLIDHIISELI